jgi:catabolite regulation protein CreA
MGDKPQYRKFRERNNYNENIDYFMENLDDPDVIFNKVCFLCNSASPNLSQIQAKSKDEEDNKIKDLQAHNFELGLIKLAEQDKLFFKKKGSK